MLLATLKLLIRIYNYHHYNYCCLLQQQQQLAKVTVAMSDRHITFYAAGVRVTFPFQPYDIQREYIECVVRAATNKQNALLESPTGTGKTLSLLCSSLAWQQTQTVPNRMIYYTSRTHVQLSQAAKEMKRTAYAKIPAVVIASRAHLCLNDEVKQQSLGQEHSINRACHNAIAKNACAYYSNYEQKMERIDFNNVHDIEDLDSYGRKNHCCPYYTSKKIAETKASLVFMPYNYLLDLSLRKSTQLRLDNSIVIFDEGHNIESALKESASAHFTQAYLKTIQDSCEKLPAKLNAALNSELHGLSRFGYDPEKRRTAIVDEFSQSKEKKNNVKEKEPKVNPIEELAEKLTNDKLQQVNRCAMSLLDCQNLLKSTEGQYRDSKCSIDLIYNTMSKAGVEFHTSDIIITTLESMASFWSIASVMNPATVARYLTAISSLSHFISLLFPAECKNKVSLDNHMKRLREFYVAYLRAEFEKDTIFMNSNKLIGWEMNLWCLHPAIGMKRVLDNSCVIGPRSIIITSGTLAPMRPIETELEMKFHIVREFKHLIDKDQLKIVILGESASKYSLISTYEEARKPQYSNAIGETLLTLFKVLPFGTLVFFPSYSLLNKVTSYWEKRATLWRDMCKATKIFKESKEQSTFTSDMVAFKKTIDRSGKAVFLGVCRGKLSEGTNLEANHCRSVIVIGLPFPSNSDPKIVATKDFHSRRGDTRGQAWYTQQMRRALSQAFGRVIRSKNDFGMLFLCDPRFTQYKFSLSEWIRPFYPTEVCRDVKNIPSEIKEFFNHHNVDISAISVSDANGSQNNGIFEIDHLTKMNPAKPIMASNNLFPNQSKATNGQLAIKELANCNNEPDHNRTAQDRQVEMLASYTVSQEKYNKVKTNRLPPSVDEDLATTSKRPKTTAEAFESIFSQGTEPSRSNENNPKSTQLKPQSNYQSNCYVCKNAAIRPHVTNCSCARVGCLTCIRGLNNKRCGDCNTLLKTKKFKPKLFNVFQKREV